MAVEKPMRLIRAEDLDGRLRELMNEAMEAGKEAEAAARDAGLDVYHHPDKPGGVEELVTSLREAFEEEVDIASPVEGEAVIDESEADREIAKRALMHIKLPTLREIAGSLELARSGKLEDVIDRIARELRSDPDEIARLIVKHESEPPPERRFSSRIFYVRESMDDPEALAERVSYVAKRYIRTGIARWMVIERVNATPIHLALEGTYRSYRADAEQVNDHYRLRADPHNAPVSLRINRGESLVEIQAKGEIESKALMQAFQRASGHHWEKRLPVSQKLADGHLWGWHAWSIFLVDLLNARFRSSNIEIFDMTTAGFKTGSDRSTEESDRPSVRSVRFQGRHLLDSRVACDLILRGQALAELGMVVRFQPKTEESFLIPVTIKLAEDHATVWTSFGLNDPSVANALHREITEGIRKSLLGGLADEVSLVKLARQIHDRAEADEPPDHPTFFADDDEVAATFESGVDEEVAAEEDFADGEQMH